MKHKAIYIVIVTFILGISATSCSEDEKEILPSSISNIQTLERPGGIFLQWDMPTDKSIAYVAATYQDPLLKKNVKHLSSCDTLLLPNTRQKYGDYLITLTPYSISDTPGKTIQVSAKSGKATATYISKQLTLKEVDLSSNAPEKTEGPIKNLIDGSTDTFFHTSWSEDIPGPHWLQIHLPKSIEGYFRFYYAPRKNGANKPTKFDLMGSSNGTDWFLLKKFTKDADNLPVTSTDAYNSPNLETKQAFSYLRIIVTETNTGSVYWTMSKFKFFSVTVIDPEAPDIE